MSRWLTPKQSKVWWHRLSSLCRDTRGRVSYTRFKELFQTEKADGQLRLKPAAKDNILIFY